MPVLKNPRHEKLAQLLAKGTAAGAAYQQAGYKPDRGHASRLASNGNIQQRVEELRGAGAKRAEITLQKLIERADELCRGAVAANQYGAAVSALREMGVLSGHRVEKSETDSTHRYVARLPEKSKDVESWIRQYAPPGHQSQDKTRH
jgi:hypothetical protein